MTTTLEVVTSAYGNAYSGLLFTCIFSILDKCPEHRVSVYWQDIDSERMEALAEIFPSVQFTKTNFDIKGASPERIGSKIKLWRDAVVNAECGKVLLLDSDTIVLRDPQHFFDGRFDVAFTYKDERFPLNSGVILTKKTRQSVAFLTTWLDKISEVLADARALQNATSPDFPYGGVSQMALYLLLDYDRGRTDYQLLFGEQPVIVRGFPCALLNETNSVPISEEKYILHYKGGWQPILVRGAGFTRNRPRRQCRDMYHYYLRTYIQALSFAQHRGVANGRALFPIKIPYYVDSATAEISSIKEAAHRVMQPLADVLDKSKRAVTLRGRR